MISEDGRRVGHAWFVPEDKPFGRVLFIYDIAVDPAHRRRGYARQALAEIEALARERGYVGVQLHVFGGNAGARRLYLEAGYVETNVRIARDGFGAGLIAGPRSGHTWPGGRPWNLPSS